MERRALGPGSVLPVGLVGRAEATCCPDLPDGARPVGCPPPWSSARTGGLLSGGGGSALGIATPASVQPQGQAGWCWYNQGSALDPQTDRALGPLWPEHLSPATGTLQLEPHWAERAGPPRGAGVSTSSPSCAPSPAVQEEAHAAVPRLLPQGRVPPRRPVPAAPPQPEAPGPAGSHPHGPGAQQHAPQEQGFHQPRAQVTGTVGVARVRSGGGRREPCTPAQVWGLHAPRETSVKDGEVTSRGAPPPVLRLDKLRASLTHPPLRGRGGPGRCLWLGPMVCSPACTCGSPCGRVRLREARTVSACSR